MSRRIAFDCNGDQLLEGLVVHLKHGKRHQFKVVYIHRSGIIHIVRLDKRLGMKVMGNEIEIGS